MFDILCNIFKNPGNAFSPIPVWLWNDRMDADELIRQMGEFHKKGVNGLLIRLAPGFDERISYLSEEHMNLLDICAQTAAKKRMMLVLSDEAGVPSGSAHGMVTKANPLFAQRALFAVPRGFHTLQQGEEILFTVSHAPSKTEESKEYDLILGFTGGTSRGIYPGEYETDASNAPLSADLLNPDAVDALIENTHAKYHARLGSYFGSTIIGFYSKDADTVGRGADMVGKIPWTYDLMDDFRAEGGDETYLCALLLETTDKRKKRDAENIFRRTIRRRLGRVYYAKLEEWCQKHGVALMGHPIASSDCEMMKHFDVPGQDLSWRSVEHGVELTSPDSVMAKCTADAARHMGAGRNSNECLALCGSEENPWDLTAEEMMRAFNFLFARGVNMIMPHAFCYSLRTSTQTDERPPDVGPNNIWWENYRVTAGYIKRMSWLNAMNYNNPHCAVLCSNDFMPVKATAPLFEQGYTFNYLTMDDVLNRAHIHDGAICIDRYRYDILLVDSRLRLDPPTVQKLGRMVIEGGKMYRGNDFIGYMKKHTKKLSYFEARKKDENFGKNIRFIHLTKSGYPFFLCFNEGDEDISGYVVTDKSGLCRLFDPFTGDTAELKGEICADGIRYPVTVKGGGVTVLGLNTDVLPNLGKNPEKIVTEIIALPVNDGDASFEYTPLGNKVCILTFRGVKTAVRVAVNGTPVGFLAYTPWELDITKYLTEGNNTVSVEILENAANKYGAPVKTEPISCTAEVYITD